MVEVGLRRTRQARSFWNLGGQRMITGRLMIKVHPGARRYGGIYSRTCSRKDLGAQVNPQSSVGAGTRSPLTASVIEVVSSSYSNQSLQ